MYLLDTNVVSALRVRRRDNNKVWDWADSTDDRVHFISAITIMELEVGTLRMERRDPAQGEILRQWLEDQVLPRFAVRTLPVDSASAKHSARLHVPDPMSDLDALIAGTALVHDLTVVTRNVRDFEGTGVRLLDPWEA